MGARRGARSVERGAIWAFTPVLAIVPFSVLALFVIWLPLGIATDVPLWWVLAGFGIAGLTLFVRPVQVLVLTPLLGARRPTPEEATIIAEIPTTEAKLRRAQPIRFGMRTTIDLLLTSHHDGPALVWRRWRCTRALAVI